MRALLSIPLASILLSACDPGAADDARLASARQATTEDGRAERALGQRDLVSAELPTVITRDNLVAPIGIGTETSAEAALVWIPDRSTHRALGWAPTDVLPRYLAGQSDWTLGEPASGVIGLRSPHAIAQAFGQVAIADTDNNRVLFGYAGGFPFTPTTVLGQHGSFESAIANNGGVSAESLSSPAGVAFETSFSPGRLLVADTLNHRVLVFAIDPPPKAKATVCLGQPDCASALPNRGGLVAAGSLFAPRGLATWVAKDTSDPWRGTFIADSGNHRVLHFPAFGTAADFVFGQGGDLTTAVPGKGGPSASSLRDPTAVAVEPNGSVWIADTGHHRVLHFPKGKSVADRVLGQPDFVTVAAPTVASATTLRAPEGVAIAPNGDLYVADTGHHRVLRFQKPCVVATCEDGDPCTDDRCDAALGCVHELRAYSRECSPYRCDTGTRKCQTPCGPTAPCLSPYVCQSGACVLRCFSDAACAASGRSCVDGYCCDRACSGPCESCSLAGSEGICRTAAAGPLPASRTCALAGGECGARCDGVEPLSCRPTASGTACGVESCSDGVAQLGGRCDGSGACVRSTRACAPYGCAANGCYDACAGDHHCARGARCVSGACIPESAQHASGGCGYASARAPTPLWLLLALLLRRRR